MKRDCHEACREALRVSGIGRNDSRFLGLGFCSTAALTDSRFVHSCDEAGVPWKVDMWPAPEDYALPRGEYFVQPKAASARPTRGASP